MPQTSPEHHRLIVSTIGAMRQNGMTNIKAAHIDGYTQPDQIGGYIPDVTATLNGRLYIAECESREGLTQTHTVLQWRAFCNQAARVGGSFIAVVAKADEAAAGVLLRSITNGAQNAQVWTF